MANFTFHWTKLISTNVLDDFPSAYYYLYFWCIIFLYLLNTSQMQGYTVRGTFINAQGSGSCLIGLMRAFPLFIIHLSSMAWDSKSCDAKILIFKCSSSDWLVSWKLKCYNIFKCQPAPLNGRIIHKMLWWGNYCNKYNFLDQTQ